ncbi:hypothetical protein [Kitasatospora nipponensis]|uniref:hypothetical protein n=1 Tax=Kitasatospora nipponensis TaxID=258049 RepID=UPI003CD07FF2
MARREGAAVGCIGLRTLAPGVGEVTKVYLRPAARGQGGGARGGGAGGGGGGGVGGGGVGRGRRSAGRGGGARRRPGADRAAPGHPRRPGGGPGAVRPARLPRDPALQRQPLRRPLVREVAARPGGRCYAACCQLTGE